MKKIFLSVFFVLSLYPLVSSPVVDVLLLRGPTAMGMAPLMERAERGDTEYEYNFAIEAAPDMLIPRIVQKDFTFASLPLNLASVLYQRTKGDISVVAINTLGVLYLAGYDDISSIEDLRGKTIYSAGRGATPEYALQYILSLNGLEIGKDVFVEWRNEHTECLVKIGEENDSFALLPEPFLSAAVMNNPDLKVVLDINKEWERLTGLSMVTGVTIANEDALEDDKELLPSFLAEYASSVSFLNDDVKDGAVLVGKFNIVPAQIAERAIENANIVMISGEEMKRILIPYLDFLYSMDKESIGGALPENDFYKI